jgi:CRP/FNR family transcriptional regulator, nitrogen oxide reductase regulator
MEKLSPILLEEIYELPLFHGVPQPDIARLVQAAHRKYLCSGEFFFMQGDPAERMYILVQGRVKLTQVGPDGQQALIRVITPVCLFALVAMTTTDNYLVTAQAAEDSRAFFWTRQEIMDFVLQVPQMALNAMRIMADNLQEIQERFRQVTTQRVEQRLAHTLIRLAAQSGKKIEQGILIDLPLTRQDLAEMSGTTLYTASRMLSQWEKQGLVITGRAQVILRNPHGLAKVASADTSASALAE